MGVHAAPIIVPRPIIVPHVPVVPRITPRVTPRIAPKATSKVTPRPSVRAPDTSTTSNGWFIPLMLWLGLSDNGDEDKK